MIVIEVYRFLLVVYIPELNIGWGACIWPVTNYPQTTSKDVSRHRRAVSMTRKPAYMQIGAFYELAGMNAILAIAYCGLNKMPKDEEITKDFIPRAGFPIEQIQSKLDFLTGNTFNVVSCISLHLPQHHHPVSIWSLECKWWRACDAHVEDFTGCNGISCVISRESQILNLRKFAIAHAIDNKVCSWACRHMVSVQITYGSLC